MSDGNCQEVVEQFSEKSKAIQFILFFEPTPISKFMLSDTYDISVGNNISNLVEVTDIMQ